MRILQVHNRYRNKGGEDSVLRLEADLLRSAGHDVRQHLATNEKPWPAATRDLILAPWNPMSERAIARTVEEFPPDVAHVHNTWFSHSPSVVSLLGKRDIPIVMTLHNYRMVCANAMLLRDGAPCLKCVGSTSLHAVRYRCYRDSFSASAMASLTIGLNRVVDTWKNVDLFLALTEFAKGIFVQGGLDEDRIRVKPNSRPDPGKRSTPPSDSNAVLFVGRVSPEKGLGFLSKVWSESAPPGLKLRIIGSSSGHDMNILDEAPSIENVGPLSNDQVLQEMLNSRALILPSLWFEGQPLVLVEALASGIPVMASDIGAMRELVEPMGDAWLNPVADEKAWAESLQVLSDDLEVDRAGRIARAQYVERFTEAKGLSALESAYEEVTL